MAVLVELSGRVLSGTKGYRAQHQRVVRARGLSCETCGEPGEFVLFPHFGTNAYIGCRDHVVETFVKDPFRISYYGGKPIPQPSSPSFSCGTPVPLEDAFEKFGLRRDGWHPELGPKEQK